MFEAMLRLDLFHLHPAQLLTLCILIILLVIAGGVALGYSLLKK
jgi:hypothetical protein